MGILVRRRLLGMGLSLLVLGPWSEVARAAGTDEPVKQAGSSAREGTAGEAAPEGEAEPSGDQMTLPDPSGWRLMLTETARPLGKGNGAVAAHFFLAAPLGAVSYGLTDHLNLTAGMTAFPESDGQVGFASAKAAFTLAPQRGLGVGLFYAGGVGEGDGVAVLYTVATFGPPHRSLSAGLALAAVREYEAVFRPDGTYVGSERRFDLAPRPLVFVGGTFGIGGRAALVAEGWLATADDDVGLPIGAALRLFGKRFSLDLGVVTEPGLLDEGLPVLPWISLTFHFGPGRTDRRRATALPASLRRPAPR